MKANQLGELVRIVASWRGEESAALRSFVDLLTSLPATTTIAAVAKKVAQLARLTPTADCDGEDFGQIADTLSSIAEVTRLTSSAAVANGSATLAQTAHEFSGVNVVDLARRYSSPPARPIKVACEEVVAKHVSELLRRAPGTPAFGEALDALKADTLAKALEMRAIAARLNVEHPADGPRGKVFTSIAREHKIITETAAKAAALRGNSSA